MTSPARLEIQVTSERAATAVTCRARVISRGKVFLRTGRADLPFLRETPRCVVAIIAIQTLPGGVICVTKRVIVRDGCCRRARVRFRFVTHTAGSEVAAICLRVRRVARVAAVVR